MISPTTAYRGGEGKGGTRILKGLVMGSLLLLILLGPTGLLKGQSASKPRSAPEPVVKAAAVTKILPFVQWPTNAFSSSNATFVMVILDAPEVAAQLQKTNSEQKIGDHPVQIRKQVPDSWNDVRLVYIGREHRRGLATVPEAARKLPILLVGEQPGFAKSGGIINLLISEDSPQIEISREAASKVGIRFSSHLASIRAIRWIDESPNR